MTQAEKAERFRALHQGPGAFVMPNPWDGGSARVLAGLGFQALATSSGAAADLEKCFSDSPQGVAETVRLAAQAGLVGCSVEDATGNKDRPLYEMEVATERVRAAAAAARSAGFPFTLTARTENFLRGNPSLEDTIKRLQAFERAGADVLFAPGLPDLSSIKKVCEAVSKPVNFMAGIKGKSFSVAELEKAGVRRISLATSLWRAALTGVLEAAREVKEQGTFGYLDRLQDINRHMRGD